MRGGYRRGAGRPPGSSNLNRGVQQGEFSSAAKKYSQQALETLVDVAVNGRSELARVSAANSYDHCEALTRRSELVLLFDRVFGFSGRLPVA